MKPSEKQEVLENYQGATEADFHPYLAELYALADQVDETASDTSDLPNFIEA